MSIPDSYPNSDSVLEGFDESISSAGPDQAIDRLLEHLRKEGPPRVLLEMLLLKARFELGLPLVDPGPLKGLPEAVRSDYENRYIDAIRHVGQHLLQSGDIVAAWPYFRLLGEREPVAQALERIPIDPEDQQVDSLIEIAFNQGAHPRKGLELILRWQGICPAISAFEHLPQEEDLREDCASLLVDALHATLLESLQGDIAQREGQPLPMDAGIRDLLANRPELLAEDNYHTDLSHLAAVVRLSLLLKNRESIEKARDLAHYGRHLSSRLTSPGEPPFDDLYASHEIYLSAILGDEIERAVTFFHQQAVEPDPQNPLPALVLIRLLERLGRLDQAREVAESHLPATLESHPFCSSFPSLCEQTGQTQQLASAARQGGELVLYAAARLLELKSNSL